MAGVRPVFLHLFKIHLPVAGWASIAHRLSGLLLFLCLPLGLALLARALADEAGFHQVAALIHGPWGRLGGFLLLWALLHHLLAGVRCLFLDLDLGVGAPHYRRTAWLVLAGAPLAALALTGLL